MLSNLGIALISAGAVIALTLIGRVGRPHYPVYVMPVVSALLVTVGLAGYTVYRSASPAAIGIGAAVSVATAVIMISLLRRR